MPECYPRFLRSLLLCANSPNELANMTTAEIDGDLWTIPASRYKTKIDHVLPLTEQAKALIGGKPAGFEGNSWFVFSTTGGKKGFSGFSKAKKQLDAEIAKIQTGGATANAAMDSARFDTHGAVADVKHQSKVGPCRAGVGTYDTGCGGRL